jgi:hypothetical protein
MFSLSRVFLGMMIFLFLASPASGKRVTVKSADFYVAEDGNDLNPGSLSKPFASLARARDAVRELKKQKQNQDILVYIRDGIYTLDETVVFGLEDSGSENQTITYAACPGESAEFTSAKFLFGWKKPISPQRSFPRTLSAEARRNVWILDMPETKGGKWSFKTLYSGNERLMRARKGFDPIIPYEGFEFEGPLSKVLLFPEGVLKKWYNLYDIEISIVPRARWQHNFLGLKSVDEDNQVAIPSLACTYQMTKSPQRSPSCYVENALDYLDEPGEWVLNTRRGKLYYWSRSGNPNREGINAPYLRELIRIEGQIDYDGPVDKPVKYLRFKGLYFTKGDRYSWNAKDATTHSEWELYDKAGSGELHN